MSQTAKQGICRAFDIAERLGSGEHFRDAILPAGTQSTTEGTYRSPFGFLSLCVKNGFLKKIPALLRIDTLIPLRRREERFV